MKSHIRAFAILVSFLLTACGGTSEPAGAAPSTSTATASHDHGAAGESHDQAAPADGSYACPMHPEVKGNKGDRCPKCNMFLTEGGREMGADGHEGDGSHDHSKHGADHDAGDGAAADFYCPMHPEVTSKEAGQRCGKCNMFLVKPGDEASHTGG